MAGVCELYVTASRDSDSFPGFRGALLVEHSTVAARDCFESTR